MNLEDFLYVLFEFGKFIASVIASVMILLILGTAIGALILPLIQ